MYKAHFNLKINPFGLLPDPDFLYLSKRHADALAMLEYGLFSRTGVVLITGGIGCGKTTLVRELLKNKADEVVVGMITNTHSQFGDLLRWVARSFKLDFKSQDKVELYEQFEAFLADLWLKGKKATLIIDEAQNLDVGTLEELRMLSNMNVEKEPVLQIIMIGQPELRETLKRPELHQLTQRIAIDYYLEPLEPDEVSEYIKNRLKIAEGDVDLFDADAAMAVYLYSGGVPRLINILCDTALVYGYAMGLSKITDAVVEEVAYDKSKISILPLKGLDHLS